MEYKKGDILEVKRGLYSHYGVYVGDEQVIHFSADNGNGTGETNPFNADIIKTDLETFQKGNEIYVDNRYDANFTPDEIVSRAENLLGTQKGKYNLAVNNCEHFANWCKTGSKYSHQVDEVKNIVPNGDKIYESLEMGHKTVLKIEEAYEKQTKSEDIVYDEIERETERIVKDYNEKLPEVTTEAWLENTFSKINPLASKIEFVREYISDVYNELDYYDSLKKDYDKSTTGEYGIHPLSWFQKQTNLGNELNKNISDLYNERLGEFFEEKAHLIDVAVSQNPVEIPEDNPYAKMDNNDAIGRKEKILVLATGLKIAGSTYLHIEIPNAITVPVAACAVDCGESIKNCVQGKISVPQCVGECSRNVIVAATHIIKKAPQAAAEIGSKLISKLGAKISVKSAAKNIKTNQTTITTANSLKTEFSNKASGFKKLISSARKKVVSGATKVFGKVFSKK